MSLNLPSPPPPFPSQSFSYSLSSALTVGHFSDTLFSSFYRHPALAGNNRRGKGGERERERKRRNSSLRSNSVEGFRQGQVFKASLVCNSAPRLQPVMTRAAKKNTPSTFVSFFSRIAETGSSSTERISGVRARHARTRSREKKDDPTPPGPSDFLNDKPRQGCLTSGASVRRDLRRVSAGCAALDGGDVGVKPTTSEDAIDR